MVLSWSFDSWKKREIGENPIQSRCCDLHYKLLGQNHCKYILWEGAKQGSKSENLPSRALCISLEGWRGATFGLSQVDKFPFFDSQIGLSIQGGVN